MAFFIPALVYMADAIGTQSEAIAVRGLSLTRSGIAHLVAAELRTGALIGAALGVLGLAWLFHPQTRKVYNIGRAAVETA